jgi:hypothetical protein
MRRVRAYIFILFTFTLILNAHHHFSDHEHHNTEPQELSRDETTPNNEVYEDGDGASSISDVEDTKDADNAPKEGLAESEGPELNTFSIDDVAHNMDGQCGGDGEDGEVAVEDIDLDNEPNPDSDIENIVLSDEDDF